MVIVYIGNFSQTHCTEVHLAKTLENLGHEVIRLQENNISNEWVQNIPIGVDMILYTRTWGNFVTLQHLEQLKQRNITTVSYHLDLYVGLKRKYLHQGKSIDDILQTDPFWRTDYVFTPDGDARSQEVFERNGVNHIYMKPGVFKDECYIPENKVNNYDVLFVGGGDKPGSKNGYGHEEWGYRDKLVGWLYDTYGDKFTKFGHPQETIRNDKLNQLYKDTKVVIGDSVCIDFNHEYYWSDRVYETLGRGGFLIHPYIKGLEEEFTDGENIVFYEYGDFEDLKYKIDYYLENDTERERIRLNGHNFVKDNATYNNRLERMINIVNNNKIKINLGAGEDQKEGYINTDFIDLPGIDKVFNLMEFPYPFEDNCATDIRAVDVIEHLANYTDDKRPSVIAFIEECHRILEVGGNLFIQTPGYNAEFLWVDPTHVRGFHMESMDFFDPSTEYGKTTGFYSKCKFSVTVEELENHNLRFNMVKL